MARTKTAPRSPKAASRPRKTASRPRKPKASENSVRRLTIYQLREGYGAREILDELGDRDDVEHAKCKVAGLDATLVSRQIEAHDVTWWADIKKLTRTKLAAPKAQSAGAALIVSVDSQTFVIAYGDGRHLIPASAIVDRFGLRVALNAVDPDKLRALDHARVDAFARNTREQTTIPGSTRAFGIDVAQDLLSAVVGTPSVENSALGSWVVGKDAVTLPSAKIEARALPDLLRQIADLAGLLLYKAHFPWVDNIRPIDDPETRSKVNDLLISKLASGEYLPNEIALGLPDIVEWENVAGFRYSSSESGPVYDQPDLAVFLAEIGTRTELTVDKLRGRRVFMIDSAGSVRGISAWKCLVAELEDGVERFALHNGLWYKVDEDFVAEVERDYQRIPLAAELHFPDFDDGDESDYIRRVAAQQDERFTVFDGSENLIAHGGGKSKIEFCDLFERLHGEGCRLVHLKRYSGSATLSHLFAQGIVSAETYLSDSGFRDAVTAKMPCEHQPNAAGFNPRQSEVVFGVIQRQGEGRPHMPFFSRLNLRTAVRKLEGLGFRVTLCTINDLTPPPKKKPRKRRSPKRRSGQSKSVSQKEAK